MAKEIGRKHSIAIGTETTAGTLGTIDAWIPLEDSDLKPVTKIVKDSSGYGTITSDNDAHVAQTWAEFTGKGIVRPTTIGWLLLGTMGQVDAPSLVETGVYKHAFTLKDNNNHPSYSVIHDDATQEEQSLYNMVDSLTLSGEVGDYTKFDLKMKGRLPTNTTGNTPAFATTGENPFMVSKASIKFASAVAGLSGATRTPVQNFKVTFDKNLEQIFSTSSDGTEALNFATQHNKNFTIKGDMEVIYNDVIFRDLFTAGTKQAIEISLEGRTLIGATKYENLTIQLASVVLEDWGRTTDKDGIVTQSFGFTAVYKLAETKIATIDLTNARATVYS